MNEHTVNLPEICEKFTAYTHKSGLKVFLSEKDFHTSYALLCVNFGSLCEKSTVNGEKIILPDGIAHFLEHKMFENEDGEDTFAKFSRLGANANAYTGTDRTCYLFSACEEEYKSLEVLIKSVFSPCFTKANVKKEKGIIIQELKMYRDDPNEAVSRALLQNMYRTSRLKNDICGSVTSVNGIKDSDLYKAYNTFYTPGNMILSLCGKFAPQKVNDILDRYLQDTKPKSPVEIEELCREQTTEVKKRRARVYKDITTPVVSIGIKCDLPSADQKKHLLTFNAMCVIAYALFSPNAPFVAQLKKDNLIPDDTSFDVVHSAHCSHILFSCETYDPGELIKRFEKERKRIAEEGIAESFLLKIKKVLFADFLDNFNSAEGIAHLCVGDALDGIDTGYTVECIDRLTKGETDAAAKELLSDGRICILTALQQNKNTK